MKAQIVNALDTIAKMSYALKEHIVFHSRFTNDGEFNEAIDFLKKLGHITTSEQDTDYFITPFGLSWLEAIQGIKKVPNFHEATNFSIEITKRLCDRRYGEVTKDSILRTYQQKDEQIVLTAIEMLVSKKILVPIKEYQETYDVVIEQHTIYLYGI